MTKFNEEKYTMDFTGIAKGSIAVATLKTLGIGQVSTNIKKNLSALSFDQIAKSAIEMIAARNQGTKVPFAPVKREQITDSKGRVIMEKAFVDKEEHGRLTKMYRKIDPATVNTPEKRRQFWEDYVSIYMETGGQFSIDGAKKGYELEDFFLSTVINDLVTEEVKYSIDDKSGDEKDFEKILGGDVHASPKGYLMSNLELGRKSTIDRNAGEIIVNSPLNKYKEGVHKEIQRQVDYYMSNFKKVELSDSDIETFNMLIEMTDENGKRSYGAQWERYAAFCKKAYGTSWEVLIPFEEALVNGEISVKEEKGMYVDEDAAREIAKVVSKRYVSNYYPRNMYRAVYVPAGVPSDIAGILAIKEAQGGTFNNDYKMVSKFDMSATPEEFLLASSHIVETSEAAGVEILLIAGESFTHGEKITVLADGMSIEDRDSRLLSPVKPGEYTVHADGGKLYASVSYLAALEERCQNFVNGFALEILHEATEGKEIFDFKGRLIGFHYSEEAQKELSRINHALLNDKVYVFANYDEFFLAHEVDGEIKWLCDLEPFAGNARKARHDEARVKQMSKLAKEYFDKSILKEVNIYTSVTNGKMRSIIVGELDEEKHDKDVRKEGIVEMEEVEEFEELELMEIGEEDDEEFFMSLAAENAGRRNSRSISNPALIIEEEEDEEDDEESDRRAEEIYEDASEEDDEDYELNFDELEEDTSDLE